MDNFPITIIKCNKHGKHYLIDKLVFLGINSL